ncbi:MAG: Rne/Rng family ribonuclease [Novosphingobium sp.]|nr:Rne/Rng family ribonuclease [Novosphingobium sp.]
MATRMLIDARHPEETRVAVLKGNRIEEFDFESSDRKQIKGNIYLAKVTRVEPSLQAAFVDFGGNRHGFLAFSEIHPDYYQIPKEDREALLAEEAAHAEEEAALRDEDEDDDAVQDNDADDADDTRDGDDEEDGGLTEVDTSEKDSVSTIEAGQVENGDDEAEEGEANDSEDESVEASDDDESDNGDSDDGEDDDGDSVESSEKPQRRGRRRQGRQTRGRSKKADDLRSRRMALRRRYKIQDVIQRRQVLLVQVVKEERGNKGAALTTYLSLAGRYCVLMPNSSHGGGISRKINSASDRKRLKTIVSEMNLPRSMGCIVRTAGLSRTKTEIKRDFDYLARLWDELREKTLTSSAPMLIHSDSDLIKRAIRDIYNRDIEEVIVEGEAGYKAAKDFMKLLMPSHARRVKPFSEPVPLFQRYGAEDQLSAMYDPEVQLKSGGYIVINPTEALVSIDINSGRSTKEHGIEATALNTNLEAAREVARQLRLRDMAGLVVIDFIDMEYGGNIRKIERAMKDALKHDRARIQVGRISSFGLMEMSRQRLRTGVLEATTRECPHCDGTGLVRTAGSAGLSALRQIEDEAAKGKGSVISLYASTEAAVYLLNAKRSDLAEIEALYGVRVEVIPEGENEGAKMRVASSGPRNENMPTFEPIVVEEDDDDEVPDEDSFDDEEGIESGRRKRRGRRRGRGRDKREDSGEESTDSAEGDKTSGENGEARSTEDGEEAPKKRRRRGGRRRRGRNRSEEAATEETGADTNAETGADSGEVNAESEAPADDTQAADASTEEAPSHEADGDTPEAEGEAEPAPKKRPRRRKKPAAESDETAAEVSEEPVEAPEAAEATEAEPTKPKRSRRKKPAANEAPADGEAEAEAKPAKPKRTRRKKVEEEATEPVADAAVEDKAVSEGTDVAVAAGTPAEPARRGWWNRTFGE